MVKLVANAEPQKKKSVSDGSSVKKSTKKPVIKSTLHQKVEGQTMKKKAKNEPSRKEKKKLKKKLAKQALKAEDAKQLTTVVEKPTSKDESCDGNKENGNKPEVTEEKPVRTPKEVKTVKKPKIGGEICIFVMIQITSFEYASH